MRLLDGKKIRQKALKVQAIIGSRERKDRDVSRNEHLNFSEISKRINRSKSTVSEEIRRGRYNRKYRAEIAQKRCIKRRCSSHKHTKWRDPELLRFIEHKKHRPEWKKWLICGRKRRRPDKQSFVGKIPDRISISGRPQEVNLRQRFGDYEADTVLSSKGIKACLAVFVERKSRMYFFAKMKNKTSEEMACIFKKVCIIAINANLF